MMSDGFWKKMGTTLLGNDAMKVVDRMADEKREKEIRKARQVLCDAGEYAPQQRSAQALAASQPATDVEMAAQAALKRLEAAKKDGSSMSKMELIKAAQAIHRRKQSVLDDLDPKTRQNLQELAKSVFGLKDG